MNTSSYRFCLLSLFLAVLTNWGISQPFFSDQTVALGIETGPGAESVAVGDFNNDGWEDIYVGFFNRKNQLWQNLAGQGFVEVGASANVSLTENANTRSALWGDLDNDGFLDLYVGNKNSPDKLFRNNGDGTFSDISMAAGIFQIGHPQSVNMADVDGDGWLDIYVSNFSQQNILYHNNGDLTFTNQTLLAGVGDLAEAMGSIFFDYDKDGDVDLYLVHDQFSPNLLYQNDGAGYFTEVGAAAGVNTSSFGMGVDIGDINNDGWLDIYVTNLYPNFLLLNNTDGTFTNIFETAGVDDSGMGWGTSFLDFNKDGLLDIYAANDYAFSPFRNVLFQNNGDLTFAKAQEGEAICNEYASYGTAAVDYNLDGNIDLLIANRDEGQGLQVFENAEYEQAWIGLKLIGVESNRQAVGARVELVDNQGRVHYDEVTAGNGWTSQGSQLFHFGLGAATAIVEANIYWPSGLIQNLNSLEIGAYYTVIENEVPVPGIVFGTTTSTTSSALEPSPIVVYPNPSSGQFVVECADTGDFKPSLIRLYDQSSRLLLEAYFDCQRNNLIDLGTDLATRPQLLHIELIGNGCSTIKRVIVY